MVLGLGLWLAGCGAQAQEPVAAPDAPAPSLPADRLIVPLDIPPGSSFGPIMEAWGLPAYALRESALEVHDLARIHQTSEFGLQFVDGMSEPSAVRYAVDEDRVLVLARADDGWRVEIEDVPYEAHEVQLVLEMTSSLWEAGMAAGLRASDLYRLASIFEYEIDFNTELRSGARMGLVGEMLSSEGRKDKLGAVHALRFDNGGKTYEMVRFVDSEGKEGFYHPDGTASVHAFLRSPLEFSRVTSGFNPRRFHPVLKTRRPHNGTDFGAPSGTPVRSVADGVVTYAGRNGGHGNFVKIKHDDITETSYSHLSAITVRKGQRVTQGATVGRVGTTGLSTGPHLHYQMWQRGRFIDPMRADLPVSRPLVGRDLDALKELVATWLPKVP